MAAQIHAPGAGVVGTTYDAASVAVTVRGDGVLIYSAHDQKRLGSIPLGAAHAEFQTAAARHGASGTVAVVLRDTASAQESLVVFKQGEAAFKTLSSVSPRVNVPAAAHSVHILSSANASGAAAASSAAARAASLCVTVVLQGGRVGYAVPDASDLRLLSSSSAASRSAATQTLAAAHSGSLVVATQQSAGAAAQVSVYRASAGASGSGNVLAAVASCSVACPTAHAALTHISLSGSYALLQWSCGTATIVRGTGAGSRSLSQPVHLQVLDGSAKASTSDAAAASTRKRKGAQAPNGSAAAGQRLRFLCAAMDDSQFAVLDFDAAASHSQLAYSLHDAQFGCPVGSGTVDVDAPLLALDTGRCSVVQAGSGEILLQLEGAVFMVSLQTQPVSLLSLVAKLAVSQQQQQQQQQQTNASSKAVPALAALPAPTAIAPALLTASPAQSAATGASSQDEDLVLLPVPESHVTRQPDIANELVAQLGAVPAGKAAPKQVLDSAVSYLSGCRQQGMCVPPQLAALTATKLADSGAWSQLESLLTTLEPGSLCGCEGLLVLLAEGQQYGMLSLACTRLDDITPKELVAALRRLLAPTTRSNLTARKAAHARLRKHAEALVTRAEASVAAPSGPGASASAATASHALALAQCAAASVDAFSYREATLHPLLAVNMDSVGLQGALRSLNAGEVEALLAYLGKWLAKYGDGSLGEAAQSVALPKEMFFPTHMQVLEWIRVTIDAHLARLLLSRAPVPCLEVLERSLGLQVAASHKLCSLQGAAEHVMQHAPLPSAHVAVATQYTAEVIDLRVLPPRVQAHQGQGQQPQAVPAAH